MHSLAIKNGLLLASILFGGLEHLAAQIGFASPNVYFSGNSPLTVLPADVNGDGKVDLVGVNGGSLAVFTNNGSGGFVTNAVYTNYQTRAACVADVNNDGWIDLISAPTPSGPIAVLTNDHTGRFVLSSSWVIDHRVPAIAAADVNKDGWVDLITADSGYNTLSVFTNNRSGGFALSGSYAVGRDPWSIACADVNGDGWPDLICANYESNSLSVLTNDGTGGFGLFSTLAVGAFPFCVVAADINDDGKIDLISANSAFGAPPPASSLSILTNNGNGFTLAATCPVGRGPCGVVAVDINNDGKIDLISGNSVDNNISVLTNNGRGEFSLAAVSAVSAFGSGPQGTAAADVNGDGRMDIITANNLAGSISVMINAPTLAIKKEANSAVVSWPSFWTNWTLRSNANLATTNWAFVSGVSNNGTNMNHTIPPSASSLFFRLSYP